MEQKELWIIGGVLLFIFLFNQLGYTGQAFSVTDRYEARSAHYRGINPGYRGWLTEGVPVRQPASTMNNPNVGYLSPNEYRSQKYPQMPSSVGGPCYLNDNGLRTKGTLTLGEGNSLYCG